MRAQAASSDTIPQPNSNGFHRVSPGGPNGVGVTPDGVTNRLFAGAIRRIKSRRESDRPSTDVAADVTTLLTGLAVAAERDETSFLESLVPRHSLQLITSLADVLEDELLALSRSGNGSPAEVLEGVCRLRAVRAAILRRFHVPGTRFVGPDSLEYLIEFVHDMRSPLSSLQVLADGLQEGLSGALTPLQQRQLGLIHGVAHALNTVTSNALQLIRKGDQPEPEARRFSVLRLLSDIEKIVSPLASLNGLELKFVASANDVRLGHPDDLQRILLNLTTNALKFTPPEGRVTVSAVNRGDADVEFAVEDTGPGISKDVQATLFLPFRRRSGRPAFSSTGLGLAIAQRLVHELGGQLRYETAAGKGTRFYFVLSLPVPDPA
jgi:signal transduction histidine kinase